MGGLGKIGILNGGGDCPGLNAVTRAVVRAVHYRYGGQVVGIFDGFDGLIWPEKSKDFTPRQVRGILHEGGTIVATTSRANPFKHRSEEGGQVVCHEHPQTASQNDTSSKLQ